MDQKGLKRDQKSLLAKKYLNSPPHPLQKIFLVENIWQIRGVQAGGTPYLIVLYPIFKSKLQNKAKVCSICQI